MSDHPTISASRVAMMLGQSRFGTRLSLFNELAGQTPPREDSELLEEGREFEEPIARIACRKYGLRLVDGPKALTHGDLSGHPDRYVIDQHGKLAVLEIKDTLHADIGEISGWGDPGSDRVPPAYLLQAMVYGHLLVKTMQPEWNHAIGNDENGKATPVAMTGVSDTVYLAARLRSGTQLYKIKVDPEIIAHIEAEASAFLDRVARGEPPDPSTGTEAARRWLPQKDKAVEFGPAEVEWAKALATVRTQKKALETEEDRLKLLILSRMQDGSTASYNGRKILSAGADREFDADRFALENPGVAGMFQKLDAAAVRKAHKALTDGYLSQPPAERQKRVIRLNDLEGL